MPDPQSAYNYSMARARRAARHEEDLIRVRRAEGVQDAEYRSVFWKFVRRGFDGLAESELATLNRGQSTDRELRALGVGTGGGGGFTVPQSFYSLIQQAQLQTGGALAAARILDTDTGQSLPIPVSLDTTNTGQLLAENTAAAEADPAFGQLILGGFMYSSKIVRVSLQLVQDEGVGLDGLLASALGTRIARAVNPHLTTGTGSGQPFGITVDAPTGATAPTGNTTTFPYDSLVDLVHSVDAAYRFGAVWQMHDSSVKALRKVKDTSNQPLIPTDAEDPPPILGHRLVINNDMPVMAANAKSLAFGQFGQHFVRRTPATFFRLVERYAEFGQVGFLLVQRLDGRLLNPSGGPVKLGVNSAT